MNPLTHFFITQKSSFHPKEQVFSVLDKIKLSALGSGLSASLFAVSEQAIEQQPAHRNPFLKALMRSILQPTTTLTINNLLLHSIYGTTKAMALGEQAVYCLGINLLGLFLLSLRERSETLYKLLHFLLPLLFFIELNPRFLYLLKEGFIVDALQTVLLPLLGMTVNEISFQIGQRAGRQLLNFFFREEQAIEAENPNPQRRIPYLSKYTAG